MALLIYLFDTHCFITETKAVSGGCQNKKEIVMLANLDFCFTQPVITTCADQSDCLVIDMFIWITDFLIKGGKWWAMGKTLGPV